ncbi:MAG: class I SAM-dependent methyltransferase [Verrucomicrobiota bacterium]
MGHDARFLLHKLTHGFEQAPPWKRTCLHLIEGDSDLLARGREFWRGTEAKIPLDWEFIQAALVEPLPLASDSQNLAVCSEVVEHLVAPENLFAEIFRILKPGGFLILTTDNSPSALQMVRRIPVWLKGQYRQQYARPDKAEVVTAEASIRGKEYEIYGHINLNPTRIWEQIARGVGFEIFSFGTYESIRRGGGSKSPGALAFYFTMGFIVSLLPRSLGRFFGDTTALLLRKPQ